MNRRFALFVGILGCGCVAAFACSAFSSGGNNSGVAADSAADSGASVAPEPPDGSTPSVVCDPAAAFGAPVELTGLDVTHTEEGMRLSDDSLTAYYSETADDVSTSVIYSATRSATDASFTDAAPVSIANIAYGVSPSITSNAGSLFFLTTSAATPMLGTASGPGNNTFGKLRVIPMPENPFPFSTPIIRPDGAVIYYVINNTIVWANVSDAGVGGQTKLAGIARDGGNDQSPALTQDDQVIYFASDRSDPNAAGDFDIWVATRTGEGVFGTPRIVLELNTGAQDIPTFISADRCTIYFYRADLDAGVIVSRNMYVATKSP